MTISQISRILQHLHSYRIVNIITTFTTSFGFTASSFFFCSGFCVKMLKRNKFNNRGELYEYFT